MAGESYPEKDQERKAHNGHGAVEAEPQERRSDDLHQQILKSVQPMMADLQQVLTKTVRDQVQEAVGQVREKPEEKAPPQEQQARGDGQQEAKAKAGEGGQAAQKPVSPEKEQEARGDGQQEAKARAGGSEEAAQRPVYPEHEQQARGDGRQETKADQGEQAPPEGEAKARKPAEGEEPGAPQGQEEAKETKAEKPSHEGLSPIRLAVAQLTDNLRQTVQWLVAAVRALVQAVRYLLQAVASLLKSLVVGIAQVIRPVTDAVVSTTRSIVMGIVQWVLRIVLRTSLQAVVKKLKDFVNEAPQEQQGQTA